MIASAATTEGRGAPAPVLAAPLAAASSVARLSPAELALAAAKTAAGGAAPNPPVGCVLHREGRVLAVAATGAGGRPHAEELALAQLKESGLSAEGAEATTTLEPCAHERPGGSCAARLAEAGIASLAYLLPDPDPRTAGKGAAVLAQAGVPVRRETNLELVAAAYRLALGHICRSGQSGFPRPYVALKLAASLDGRISPPPAVAAADPNARWLTGKAAQARVHRMRAAHDAILIGGGTAAEDNPRLSVRHPREKSGAEGADGAEGTSETAQPLRVVLDTRLRLCPDQHLAEARSQPTLVFTRPESDPEARAALAACPGVEVEEAPLQNAELGAEQGAEQTSGAALDLRFILARLHERGTARVLCEGGARLASSLLHAGLIDTLAWFTAPIFLGAEGGPALVPPYAPPYAPPHTPTSAPPYAPRSHTAWARYARESFPREDGAEDDLSLFLADRHWQAVRALAEGGTFAAAATARTTA